MSDRIYRLLAINPGSTSTKLAVFENNNKIFDRNIAHRAEDLEKFQEIPDQKEYRRDMILEALEKAGYHIEDMDAFVGRGGGMVGSEGGTYPVEGILLEHAATCFAAKHPSVLGAVLSYEFSELTGKPAYIVNPPDVDELQDVARLTGVKGRLNRSRFHALNQKEIGHRAAERMGTNYEKCNFIIAHIGGGISIAAHRKGRVIDVNDIISGDGPMAPTRCGSLSALDMIELCFDGGYTKQELLDLTRKTGGLVSLLGTSDTIAVEQRMRSGDLYAKLVYDAMIYQIGKCIGSMAAVLNGEVDRIVLTGGISHSKYVVESLKKMCGFLAPLQVFAGEFEMEALAAGVLRILTGEEELKHYAGKPVFQGFEFDKNEQ